MFVLHVKDKEIIMDLKELLKQKQQKNKFNQQQTQKVPVMAQKPMKKVTGRGR
jgi:hypothetical protein